MTPEEIKNFVEANFTDIVSEQRNNPDGWSFYFKEVRKGTNSSRIARAVQANEGSPTRFKLAVSARLNPNGEAEIIDPNEQQVRELFEHELELWVEHFQ
ncbi:hypothetical protein NDI45_08185 [Leptolyngbya sp. GB1-A1]|uniref:hypothetical protein n=1 Tax=Leptolyngbya sp. GB1-A1 TaxID=2933908 RepID=UPI003297B4BF